MYKSKKLGTIGDVAIASFQQNKMITCGEGGLIFTNNEEYFVRAVRYHDLGFVRPVFEKQLEDKSLAKPEMSFIGMQFRMSELQGAFILAQFRKLDMILERCGNYHKRIREYFNRNEHFKIRYRNGDCGITFYMLFKTKEEAQKFSECLKAEGIPIGPSSNCLNIVPQYPIKSKKTVHDALPPFGKGFDGEHIDYNAEECCINTDKVVERFVAIGIGPRYSEQDIADIINAIEKIDNYLY
jgi:8-amino-3,8-dideoxy-alpha-D-manno-octulosonate transaminase